MVAVIPAVDLQRTGARIDRIRRMRGLSVKQMQVYFGFENPQAIYKWLRGESLPTVENLYALAKLLQVRMEDLLVFYGSQEASSFFTLFQSVSASSARAGAGRQRSPQRTGAGLRS